MAAAVVTAAVEAVASMAAAAVADITVAAAVLNAAENPAADIPAACVLPVLKATAAAVDRAVPVVWVPAVWVPREEACQEEARARVVPRIFVPPSTMANGIHLVRRTQAAKPSPPTTPEWPTTIGMDLTAPEKPVLAADSAERASVGAAVGVVASDGRSGAVIGDLPGASAGIPGGMVLPGTDLLTLIPITRTRITVTTGPITLHPMLRRPLQRRRRMVRQETVLRLALTRPERETT